MINGDREVLFSNESFVVGMLQAVSGGAIVAAISQLDTLIKNGGRMPFLIYITAMGIGLALALLAAYWKHQYKLWDIKARASNARAIGHRENGNDQLVEDEAKDATERYKKSTRFLNAMRSCMAISLFAVLFGLGDLVFAFWTSPQLESSKQQIGTPPVGINKPVK
jgi:hypothetical protein